MLAQANSVAITDDEALPPEIHSLFEQVLADLGYKQGSWHLCWTTRGNSWCDRDRQIVYLENCETAIESAQLLLHEIAHINGEVEPGYAYHGPQFWRLLERLVFRYLGCGLDEPHIRMRDLVFRIAVRA